MLLCSRVIVLIITARISSVVAIGALLLAFTVELRASLQRDPFGGDNILCAKTITASLPYGVTNWLLAIDQETVKACDGDALSDCRAALKLIAIVEEARGDYGRAKYGHIDRAINLFCGPRRGLGCRRSMCCGSGTATRKTMRSPSISRCAKRTSGLIACAW